MINAANLETMSPAEIDAVWADLFTEAVKLSIRLKGAKATQKKYRKWGMESPHHAEAVEKAQKAYDEAIAKAKAQEGPFDAEWDRRGGWTRYTVVPGGHYHRYHGCSSLRWTTVVLWTPEHSGKTTDEIVAELGEKACTKCFSNAPVADRNAPSSDHCPGSRAFAGDLKKVGGRAYCPSCGYAQTISQRTYRIRAHKAPAKK